MPTSDGFTGGPSDGFAQVWPRLRRITIWGVGLIGGSLGQAWRAAGVAHEILGLGRDEASLAKALELGAIDRYATDPAEALACSDLIVLGGPVDVLRRWAEVFGPRIAPGTIVTDVGSVKSRVVAPWEAHLAPGAYFVGGHPMAGREQAGVAFATPTLFQDAQWVLTPGSRSTPEALGLVTALARITGARVTSMSPEQHDARVAYISHLPQLVSVALAAAAGDGEERLQEVLALAAGGFRDTTRIASSSPDMWWPILDQNQGGLLPALTDFRQELDRLIDALTRGDRAELTALFQRAADVRHRTMNHR